MLCKSLQLYTNVVHYWPGCLPFASVCLPLHLAHPLHVLTQKSSTYHSESQQLSRAKVEICLVPILRGWTIWEKVSHTSGESSLITYWVQMWAYARWSMLEWARDTGKWPVTSVCLIDYTGMESELLLTGSKMACLNFGGVFQVVVFWKVVLESAILPELVPDFEKCVNTDRCEVHCLTVPCFSFFHCSLCLFSFVTLLMLITFRFHSHRNTALFSVPFSANSLTNVISLFLHTLHSLYMHCLLFTSRHTSERRSAFLVLISLSWCSLSAIRATFSCFLQRQVCLSFDVATQTQKGVSFANFEYDTALSTFSAQYLSCKFSRVSVRRRFRFRTLFLVTVSFFWLSINS